MELVWDLCLEIVLPRGYDIIAAIFKEKIQYKYWHMD